MKIMNGVRSTLVLLVLLVLPLAALAGPHGHGELGGDHAAFLTSRLDLTEDQQTAVEALFAANRKAMQENQTALMEAHESIRQAIHAPELDETAISGAVAAMAEVETTLALGRARMLRDVRAELTPEQQEQLAEILANAPMHRRSHGPRHFGERPRGLGRGF